MFNETALHGVPARTAFTERRPLTSEHREAHSRERSEPPRAAAVRARIPVTPQRHPFALDEAGLRNFLSEQLKASTALQDASPLRLTLPGNGARPGPSDQLAGLADTFDDAGPITLGQWSVPAVSMNAADAFQFLLEVGSSSGSNAVILGPGVRWLVSVAELAGDLLIDQRFIPTIYQFHGHEWRAEWLPWLDDAHTCGRVELLAASCPPALRAVQDDDVRTARAIIERALYAMTDRVVRRILSREGFIDAIEGRDGSALDVTFLRSLLEAGDAIQNLDGSARELFRSVRHWLARLTDRSDDEPYSLCLRVHEPAPDDAGDSTSAKWRVTVHLRRTGTSTLTDIGNLWIDPDRAGLLIGSPEEVQEFVLREVGRGARVFERLKDSLGRTGSRPVQLSTDEIYEFLRETAPVLKEMGIEVVGPEWWGGPQGRLGLRVILEPADSPDSGRDGSTEGGAPVRFGLETLVRFQWQVVVGDEPLTIDQIHALAQQKAGLVRVSGRWIELHPDEIGAASRILSEGGAGVMPLAQALRAAYGIDGESEALRVVGIDSTGWIGDLLNGRTAEVQGAPAEQPRAFRGQLRPYQRAGLTWLSFLDSLGFGACLADDMGLGKTIQLIALLQHEREGDPIRKGSRMETPSPARSEEIGPTLIVAPMSVIGNWVHELARFSPELSVHLHHGPERARGNAFVLAVSNVDVVITTYALAHRDLETISQIRWHRVVLDEAQFVKNTPTKQAQAIRSIAAGRRVALTGTPVENRLSELWSIMDFLNPGYLGSAAEFKRRFANPIERHRRHDRVSALRELIRPFVLRRLKTDPEVVPDLPDLVQTKEYAVLTPQQARLYQQIVTTMLGEADQTEGMQRRGLILAGLVRLKQVCNHPANLSEEAAAHFRGVPANGPERPLAEQSGKVRCLLDRLEEILAGDEKALIFTQFRRMGELLSRIIQHDMSVPVLFMHGGTPQKKRQEMIDRFQGAQSRLPVFILSLRAGGVGLNLTAANHVFHFDRWWNPAVENQATDRAFRIGQQRTVHVHKLITTGTLEERIDEMIEEKTQLAQQIIGAGDTWVSELSTEQLRDLLSLKRSILQEPGE